MGNSKYLNKFFIILTDVTVFYVSIVLAYYMRVLSGSFMDLVPLDHGLFLYLSKWWIPLIIVGSIAYHRGYGIVVSFWDDVLIVLKSLFIAFLMVWVVLSLQKEAATVSRIVITISFFCMFTLALIFRSTVKFFLYKVMDLRERALIFEKTILNNTQTLKSFLNREWYSGFKIISNGEDHSLGSNMADALFLPIEYADEETIKKLKPNARNLIIVSEISGLSFMNTEIKTFIDKNIALIATRNGLLLKRKVLLKRVFDLFTAIAALILLSPLFIIVPLAIKLDSRGPVYFKHKRCGKKMNEFEMTKFRSMNLDGERILQSYIEEHPEVIIDLEERNKIEHDPRVTKIGRFLRKTSLDELPQLLNVLKGTMSIVGPRPDTIEAIRKYYQEYSEIYENIKPGITGLWQVSGRSDIDYAKRVKLDYLYMLNWSLWFDIVIILKTFRSILNCKGAY